MKSNSELAKYSISLGGLRDPQAVLIACHIQHLPELIAVGLANVRQQIQPPMALIPAHPTILPRASALPSSDVNRASGTDSANGGRLVKQHLILKTAIKR
jgi:hypothetical protein